MKNDIRYFIAQTKYNIKNAHALKHSFWIGVFSMVMNNVSFFVIWLLFMKATGPINGWTGIDVFGMLGVAMVCFGVTQGFFFGVRELPELVHRGSFDSVLLAPVNSFLKLSGSEFSVTAYGDLLIGIVVIIFYGIYLHFSFYAWFLFLFSIMLGCVVFISVRLMCSLVAFFIHDGEDISNQMFEIFLRPGLYPGAIFPNKLKIFCMTIIPTLI
ncbi:MAG: ABC-2 family transporter protein, partial [Patescibacteria group bacterium]